MKLTGKNLSTRRKACLSAIMSTINPTLTGLALNPTLCGDSSATNRLGHGMTHVNSSCMIRIDIQKLLFFHTVYLYDCFPEQD
jgi:hypothetical protein